MNISKTAVSILFVFISTITYSQDINFEDLNRAGPGLVKFATITGLASDADSYTKAFTETDSSRREASRQASSSYSSSSGSSNSSNSSRSSSSGGGSSSSGSYSKWRCEFMCGKTSNSVVLDASDKENAQNNAMKYGKQTCWSTSRAFYEPMWGRLADCSKQ